MTHTYTILNRDGDVLVAVEGAHIPGISVLGRRPCPGKARHKLCWGPAYRTSKSGGLMRIPKGQEHLVMFCKACGERLESA